MMFYWLLVGFKTHPLLVNQLFIVICLPVPSLLDCMFKTAESPVPPSQNRMKKMQKASNKKLDWWISMGILLGSPILSNTNLGFHLLSHKSNVLYILYQKPTQERERDIIYIYNYIVLSFFWFLIPFIFYFPQYFFQPNMQR